jgi:cathepsin B
MKLFLVLLPVAAGLALPKDFPRHEAFTQELIDYVNTKPGNTWKAGVNSHFLGVPLDVVQGMLGVKKNPKARQGLETVRSTSSAAIPSSFDSRMAFPECPSVREIRDQAACGSCWAFGAVEAITDRICIASKGANQPHISAEDLNSCCDSCGFGCDGGDPASAWQFYVEQGIVTGSNYSGHSGCAPYSIPNCDHHTTGRFKPCGNVVSTPTCNRHCAAGYDKTYKQDKWRGARRYHVDSSVEAIQREIMENGPVETDFNVYADFPSYKSGVYKHTTGSMLGGHAVKMLGWGEENGTPYWLIANSWNTDWGDKGFFKILRGSDECGIESDIQAGTPK